jgi:Mg-chelatase subunit ChlD
LEKTTANENDRFLPSIRFDRDLIWHRGRSVRYAVIDVHTLHESEYAEQRASGRTIALVLDASTSMAGPKLEAAKNAAVRFVDLLGPSDTLSIVSFSDDVLVHVENISCDERERKIAVEALRSLEPRAMTNLAGGWLQGAECAARLLDQATSEYAWVVVLTDGLANRGITNSKELFWHSSALLGKGIGSSVVAIGGHYSTDQVKAIAFGGGGRYHHGNHPDEIVELLQGELELAQEMIARDVVLEVSTASGARVEMLSDFPEMPPEYEPTTEAHSTTSYLLGSIIRGTPKGSVLKLTLPPGNIGGSSHVFARLVWDRADQEGPMVSPIADSEFVFQRGAVNSPQPRDTDVSETAARMWMSWIVRRLMDWNRGGDFVKVRSFFFEQERYFLRYCHGLPDEQKLIEEFNALKNQMIRPMPERSRREMGILHSKSSRWERDLRSRHPSSIGTS